MSVAPFDTLNLGVTVGDDEQAVLENRRRFAASLQLGDDRLFTQRQVHGTTVHEVTATESPSAVAAFEGDALIARSSGRGVAARTADCVPILIAHPTSGDVAAVHAGWRGAVANVVTRAVEALGRTPAELVVAVGPHIRGDAFEIGEDVATELEAAAPGYDVVDRTRPKPHGLLVELVRYQLRKVGVPDTAIDDVGGCTYQDSAQFFSHRRDAGRTGRHLSAIVAHDGAPPHGSR